MRYFLRTSPLCVLISLELARWLFSTIKLYFSKSQPFPPTLSGIFSYLSGLLGSTDLLLIILPPASPLDSPLLILVGEGVGGLESTEGLRVLRRLGSFFLLGL